MRFLETLLFCSDACSFAAGLFTAGGNLGPVLLATKSPSPSTKEMSLCSDLKLAQARIPNYYF
jgi:hypothetical protein